MSSLRTALCAILMMLLSSCANVPSTLPTPSADLMQPPCKASDAGKDSDEDLQADIETTECLRELRLDKYRWQAWYQAVSSGVK